MARSARDIGSTIRQFLEHQQAEAYCDACLALRFEVSLDEARRIVLMLADGPDFMRQHRKCDGCSRTVDATELRVARPRRSS
jgi:hypothetical protein